MNGIRPHLVDACVEIRTRHGLLQSTVAGKLNIDPGKVKRFESSARWSPHTDELVEVYAAIDGKTAPEVWAEAITRWQNSPQQTTPAEGDRPATSSDMRTPQDKANSLLDSAGRRSQKRVQKK